ncbi:acyl carrier protein [Azospirillum sp. YIM B02556]|uniref:Acyl carrier protein n=1 Tax=Azospirillum endophyticum TaxID=2800326 RepID=A0ABS1FGZ7_9PROT|nr:acyl carrier protein [Azospirillum endophyticum]MBK1842669.1 acyl carrier protein [Azospirillum endophyticum]
MIRTSDIVDVIVGMVTALPQAPREVDAGTNIARDLGLDSLAVMNFVMQLEDRFDVSIPMDRLAGIQTIGDLAVAIADLKGR